eukprot:1140115-Pelagomonas_calceolata.AAC.4
MYTLQGLLSKNRASGLASTVEVTVIQACVDRLVVQLEGMARDSKKGIAHVDVDQAALRVTLDVIGLVGGGEGKETELPPPPGLELIRGCSLRINLAITREDGDQSQSTYWQGCLQPQLWVNRVGPALCSCALYTLAPRSPQKGNSRTSKIRILAARFTLTFNGTLKSGNTQPSGILDASFFLMKCSFVKLFADALDRHRSACNLFRFLFSPEGKKLDKHVHCFVESYNQKRSVKRRKENVHQARLCALRNSSLTSKLASGRQEIGVVSGSQQSEMPLFCHYVVQIMLRVANPARALAPSKWRGGDKGVNDEGKVTAWHGRATLGNDLFSCSTGQQSFFDFHAEMRMLLHKCLARPSPPEAQDMSIGAQLWRLYHESQKQLWQPMLALHS